MTQADAARTTPRPLRPAAAPPHNLPAPATPLLGREAALREAASLLERPEVRLLTLTGPGGSGKTRLAVAEALLPAFAAGVWFVPLAAVAEPEFVPGAIATALGVREAPGQPLLATLAAFLREKSLLLVLDNCEHLLAAAPLVAELLASCPRLVVLATSRAPLRLTGEQEFPVPPLALPAADATPAPDALLASPAVALFCARARAVRPDFALHEVNAADVAAICRRLDGLPLALELAAARLRVLPPSALRARLSQGLDVLAGGPRDAPARQRTLRDTIAWSVGLLSEPEQALFRRLAVFAGGCTLSGANTVCNPDDELGIETLDGLTALVEHNLVSEHEGADGEPRFTMLETIRAFAAEQLASRGEGDMLHRRHAAHFLAALERRGPFIGLRSLPAAVMDWLDSVQHDMRAALTWSLAASDRSEIALRLAVGLAPYWNARGSLAEGRRWVDAALAADSERRGGTRPAALLAASNLAWFQTDFRTAREQAGAALPLLREAGDRPGVAFALDILSIAESMLGDLDTARAHSEESVALFRSLNQKHGLSVALNDLAAVARLQRDYPAASAAATEQLLVAREIENWRMVAFALRQLGRIAAEQGDFKQARRFLEESLVEFRHEADKSQIAGTLLDLGHVMLADGDPTTGRTCAEEAYALYHALGATGAVAAASYLLGHVERTAGAPARAAMRYAESIVQFVEASARRYACDLRRGRCCRVCPRVQTDG